MTLRALSLYVVGFFAITILLVSFPAFVSAEIEGVQTADAQCQPPGPRTTRCPQCTDGKPCGLSVNGTQAGICLAGKCGGKSFSGFDGSGASGISKIVGDVFKGLFQQLLQGAMGGGAGGGAGTGAFQPAPTCAIYLTPDTTTASSTSGVLSWSASGASEARIDPDVGAVPLSGSRVVTPSASIYYTMQVNGPGGTGSCVTGTLTVDTGTGIGDTLLDALGDNQSISDLLTSLTGDEITPATTTGSTTVSGNLSTDQKFLTPGSRGDVTLLEKGATVFANIRTGVSEVAGFFGSNTFGSEQPKGVAARLCQSQPWKTSFVSYIIPSTFFDGLCAWRGYAVGVNAVATVQTGSQTQTFTQPPVTIIPTQATSSAAGLNPQVAIWADPSAVRLGSRTSIFWASRDVKTCRVTGPNFNENSVAGGSATVPLSGGSTFTAVCDVVDGTTITKSVTVDLEI